MGYFPNGCGGDDYQERYCFQCANWEEDKGCPIWHAHMIWNYDAVSDETLCDVLNMFIPRAPGNVENDECTMFRRGAMSAKEAQFAEWLKLPIPRPAYDEWCRTKETA